MKILYLLSGLLLCAPHVALAQIRQVQAPPRDWITIYGGRYMDMGRVHDTRDNATLIFGESLALGAGYHRQLAPGLVLGVDVSLAAPQYQRAIAGVRTDGGRATIITPFATGRLNTGGGAGVIFYLTGGAGAFIYRLPDVDRWDPNMALLTGAGIEYQPAARQAYFLEWGRFWVYHQADGLESNRAFHSLLRVGARFGR